MDVCLLSVVCCQVEVSTSGRSLVQRSPTEYGVSECDREASIMMRPWPTRGYCTIEKNVNVNYLNILRMGGMRQHLLGIKGVRAPGKVGNHCIRATIFSELQSGRRRNTVSADRHLQSTANVYLRISTSVQNSDKWHATSTATYCDSPSISLRFLFCFTADN